MFCARSSQNTLDPVLFWPGWFALSLRFDATTRAAAAYDLRYSFDVNELHPFWTHWRHGFSGVLWHHDVWLGAGGLGVF